jgi:Bax protein
MKKFLLLVYFSLCFCLVKIFAQTEAYIKKYTSLAEKTSKASGIPRCVILAVAIAESGAGKSRNCRLMHNHFGIRGKNKLRKSHKIRSGYKQYPSDAASYEDFAAVIANKRFYPSLKGIADYTLWVNAISKAGYSVQPARWTQHILRIIVKYNL